MLPEPPTEPESMPNIIRDRGGLYPRWPLLAAIWINLCVILGYLASLYYAANPCQLGPLCRTGDLPGYAQVSIIWAGFLLSWFLAFLFGLGPLEARRTPERSSTPVAYVIWSLTNIEPLRLLLLAYSSVALLGLLLGEAQARLTPMALSLSAVVVCVGGCSLAWHPARPREDLTPEEQWRETLRQADRPLYILRNNIWPFNRLFPMRAPQATALPAPPEELRPAVDRETTPAERDFQRPPEL